jgi:hypothetical protein
MTFEDAIVLAVKKYYAGTDPEALMGAQEGEIKYTREYFDELEEELLASKGGKKPKKKKDDEDEEELEEYELG